MIAHCDACHVQYRLDGRLFDVPKDQRPTCPRCGRRLRPEREVPRRSVRAIPSATETNRRRH